MRPLPDRRSDGPRRMRKGGVGLCTKGEAYPVEEAASVYQTRRQGAVYREHSRKVRQGASPLSNLS